MPSEVWSPEASKDMYGLCGPKYMELGPTQKVVQVIVLCIYSTLRLKNGV